MENGKWNFSEQVTEIASLTLRATTHRNDNPSIGRRLGKVEETMPKKIKLRIPATTANLGPGFDALGMALSLYNYVELEETEFGKTKIVVVGEGSEKLAQDERNLVYRAISKVFEKYGYTPKGLHLVTENNIPLARGLGSSAAASLGGIMTANILAGNPMSNEEVLKMAVQFEGHPDNVTPALFGGLVVSSFFEGETKWVKITPPSGLKALIAVPDFELSTAHARSVLPATVPYKDAVFNLGRTALVVSVLATGKIELLRDAMQDRLHQPYREKLIPGMSSVLAAAIEAGASGVAISGAGPSLLAFANDNFDVISSAMQNAWAKKGINSKVFALDMDLDGIKPV